MRGAHVTKKRKIEPDPVYNNLLLAKFINRLMRHGKKTVAQTVVYDTLDFMKEKGEDDPIAAFEKAIDTVSPKVEVKARRIGGAAYQVPTEVRGPRRISLAIRWILEAANKRPTSDYKKFSEKLAAEIMDVNKNTGEAVRRRDVAHKMAEANRAFSHFRF
ncbi:MAG: 30S ribosomal protein S7 [Candidatus Levybacteria bacterium]|nr:30S ribosomal protein S7 [Candidatus Levybacteria bacterium]MBP9814841.1 30S ribosomal protein S7 [Candidatus Levybacteria bacterium]